VLEENPSSFEDMMIKAPILKGLKDAGFLVPSPIQSAGIPVAMLATDLIAQAKSGTGKTCVFVASVLNNLDCTSFRTQALALTPTREIAVQVRDVFRDIGKYLENFECHSFIGGIPMKSDIQLLKLGCQVAVGTPGRVLELIDKAHMKTMFLQTVVLDEADQLFGPSFEETIIQILSLVPKQKQLMAFTATLLDDIEDKISSHMLEPQLVCIDQLKPSLKGVKQFFKNIELVPGEDAHSEQSGATSSHKLLKMKVDALIQILKKTSFNQAVVFSNNKRRAHDIAETLTKSGWPTKHIHGSQSQPQRLMVFEKLRNFKIRILVSSDVTARGIDIERLTLVINLDIPHDAETYMHRVGRTGRFGTKGVAITFVTPNQASKFDEMVKKLQAVIEPLPEKISQEMLNLWLKEGEKETLQDLEKHRERASKRETPTLREPMVGNFKSSNKRRRAKKRGIKAQKELIEPRFLTGQRVMTASRDSSWDEAVVLELVNNNHTVKLKWKDGKQASRPVYNVVKYEKPKKIEVGCIYLAFFDESWFVCRMEAIDGDEVEVIWREWDESCEFEEDATIDSRELLAFNEQKDLDPYWNSSEKSDEDVEKADEDVKKAESTHQKMNPKHLPRKMPKMKSGGAMKPPCDPPGIGLDSGRKSGAMKPSNDPPGLGLDSRKKIGGSMKPPSDPPGLGLDFGKNIGGSMKPPSDPPGLGLDFGKKVPEIADNTNIARMPFVTPDKAKKAEKSQEAKIVQNAHTDAMSLDCGTLSLDREFYLNLMRGLKDEEEPEQNHYLMPNAAQRIQMLSHTTSSERERQVQNNTATNSTLSNQGHSPMSQSMKNEYVYYNPINPAAPPVEYARSIAPSVATDILEDQQDFFGSRQAPSTQQANEQYMFYEPMNPPPVEYARSSAPSVSTDVREDQKLAGFPQSPFHPSIPQSPTQSVPRMQQQQRHPMQHQQRHPMQHQQQRHPMQHQQQRHPMQHQQQRHQNQHQQQQRMPPPQPLRQNNQPPMYNYPLMQQSAPAQRRIPQQPQLAIPQRNARHPVAFPRVVHLPGIFYPVAHSLPSTPVSPDPKAVHEASRNAALWCSQLLY